MRQKIDQEQFLTHQLSLVTRFIERRATPWFSQHYGLTLCQWRVISLLYVSPPATIRFIAGSMHLDKADVSNACAKLVTRGLIARKENPTDRRSPTFEITPAGKALHVEVLPHRKQEQKDMFGTLSPGEMERLHRSLDRLINSLAPFQNAVPASHVPRVVDFPTYKIGLLTKLLDRLAVPWFNEKMEVTFSEWRVLVALIRDTPSTVNNLSASMHFDKAAISRVVASLVRKKCVRGMDNPNNKRSVLLEPTAKGRAVYQSILPLRKQAQEALAKNLSASEVANLHKSLAKIIAHCESAM